MEILSKICDWVVDGFCISLPAGSKDHKTWLFPTSSHRTCNIILFPTELWNSIRFFYPATHTDRANTLRIDMYWQTLVITTMRYYYLNSPTAARKLASFNETIRIQFHCNQLSPAVREMAKIFGNHENVSKHYLRVMSCSSIWLRCVNKQTWSVKCWIMDVIIWIICPSC